MSVTFVPAQHVEDLEAYAVTYIKALVIDETHPGVEIRIMSDGQIVSRPLEHGVEHYRNNPLWAEVKE